MPCTIAKTTRRPWKTDPFASIAARILGSSYDLSVVLIGDKRARALNITHRGKCSPANVLTFPLTARKGEVFLNLARIMREAHRFGLSPAGHAQFLLIHACLHLKGRTHGSTMEKAEDYYVRKFDIR